MINRQSSERILLASGSQKRTVGIGTSLSASLYKKDTTIWLSGELGAGKTTLVQGLGLGLGIEDITSPTYALENRYQDKLLHMDLYRLEEKEAQRIVEESEEFHGVRAIEWFDRIQHCHAERSASIRSGCDARRRSTKYENSIIITIKETSKTQREIEIIFNDIVLPTRSTVEEWRKEVELPEHVCKHCDAVGALGKRLAEELIRRGTVCRPEAIKAAGELHDLLRFIDFLPGSPHATDINEESQQHWKEIALRYPNQHHEEACATFLTEQGYPELATIIRPHGLNALDESENPFKTIEQKLLSYADKRVIFDKVVSLDERFDDFVRRYGNGVESEKAQEWRRRMKEIEKELFGESVTF